MRNCLFVVTAMLVAGAGLAACSGDDSPSSPLDPSPLAPAPAGAGAGPRGFAGGPPSGAADAGVARLAPPRDGYNAYNAEIEYLEDEVTIAFVPVDMHRMSGAARAHRRRAVTVWQCPVEPHHVGQVCGEPVFEDSFVFGVSRTFTLECAGWLVIAASELSADRYNGWRNAPLSCRRDAQGRAWTSVDTDGAGWDGPPPAPTPENRPPTITIRADSPYVPGRRIVIYIDVISWVPTRESHPLVTSVTGAPPELTYSWSSLGGREVNGTFVYTESGSLSGELSPDLPAWQDFHVTVTADDRTNPPVTKTFTMTIAGTGDPPSAPGPPSEPDPPSSPGPPSGPGTGDPPSAPGPPSGPGTGDPPSAPGPPSGPGSWFSPSLYDALVYNAFEGAPETNAYVIDHAANLNVVFSLVGWPAPIGGFAVQCVVPESPVDLLARRTGDAIRAVTGGSWSGRTEVVSGHNYLSNSRYGHGWLKVRFQSKQLEHWYEPPEGPGSTTVGGGGSGWLYLFINDDVDFLGDDCPECECPSFEAPNLLGAYLRELAHALGFFNVPDPSWLMHRRSTRGWYAPNELLHMRKAFELGPHYPRSSPVWSLHPPGPSPGRRPPR